MSLKGTLAVVVGGSRGLGRGAVEALAARGAGVVVVGRDASSLAALAGEVKGTIPVAGDASDERLAERVLREHDPDLVVVCAGAVPVMRAFHELTWDEFQVNWQADAKIAFGWLRHALRRPMKRGSHVVVISSGAAIQGSPVSGSYASAKRAQWFMAEYAATEIGRADLGLRVHCVLPMLNASTALGREGIAAYAERAGVSAQEFAKRFDPPLTTAIFGAAIADLAEDPDRWPQRAYRLAGTGLSAVP